MLSASEAFLSECRGRVKAFSSINFMCSLDIKIIKLTSPLLVYFIIGITAFYNWIIIGSLLINKVRIHLLVPASAALRYFCSKSLFRQFLLCSISSLDETILFTVHHGLPVEAHDCREVRGRHWRGKGESCRLMAHSDQG